MEDTLKHLDDATFVVVDTETTGLRAGEDRIIEVAAVRVRGGRIESRFQQLINPGRPIPSFITRLTGIDEEAVHDAPTADRVMPRLLDFLGDDVLVAHNLAFDRRFLDMELHRAGLTPIQGPCLCTLRLARRVLHALPSKSLSNLKRHFGIRTPHAHRALDDAEATAIVLHRLIEALRAERQVDSTQDLLRLQFRPHQASVPEPGYISRLRKKLRDSLPESPGVYFHVDAAGRVLYIGKAKNLRHRVLSYFTAIDGHPERLRRLLREVRDVTWTTSSSELAALLEESRLIKHHRPRFNRAQREYSLRPLVRLNADPARPCISLAFEVQDDGADYFGPVESRSRAEDLIRIGGELFGLVDVRQGSAADLGDPPGDAFSPPPSLHQNPAERFRLFLSGRDEHVREQLHARMITAASERRFEDAAWYRNQIAFVEDRSARAAPVARSIMEEDGVAVVASATQGQVDVVFVAHGRHRRSLSLQVGTADRHVEALEKAVSETFVEASPAAGRYREAELDEVRLVAFWMDAAARADAVVRWESGVEAAAFVRKILKKVDGAGRARRDISEAEDEL